MGVEEYVEDEISKYITVVNKALLHPVIYILSCLSQSAVVSKSWGML